MSKYVINDTTLTSIADAVRSKAGTSEAIVVSDLPQAIKDIPSGGGGGEEYFTDEDLIFTGNCTGLFAYDHWKTILEKDKDRVQIINPTGLNFFLTGSTGEDYSFLNIQGNNSSLFMSEIFQSCKNLKKFPVVSNIRCNINSTHRYLVGLNRITDPNEFIKLWSGITFHSAPQNCSLFENDYSLRNIDAVFPYLKQAYAEVSGVRWDSAFYCCVSLDELNGIPIYGTQTTSYTWNTLSGAFNYLCRVKDITFETNEDGTPVEWKAKSHTIDLTNKVGYCENDSYKNYILNYDSGIAADKNVSPYYHGESYSYYSEYADLGYTYQTWQALTTEERKAALREAHDQLYNALKDDPDWFTMDYRYSRYNHDSAVRTINSLPDTTATGTNTIKFMGEAGLYTDGGAINTLTEEEIAVATAKGWTVTLV